MISNPPDNSDPVSYECTCTARQTGGKVLLFYRYWDNEPALPAEHKSKASEPQALADFHKDLASRLDLGGKFRIAREGFNITLGGTDSSITTCIEECSKHWSFSGIDLSSEDSRKAYFKPTPGCSCAFGGKASIKVTAEITPLGITDYLPTSWSNVISLPPEQFHELCKEGSIPMIDVRNHYESRIGYFVNSKGEAAVRPAVRRFSQWPGYVSRHVLGNDIYKKPIATYCTGGIRCEKGARWMQEALAAQEERSDAPVYTLHGGIVAYQEWMQREIEAGHKTKDDSFFKGKNYVFDARGAIGLDEADPTEGDKVSNCHVCNVAEDRLGKCKGSMCHLVLVVCQSCDGDGDVWCCSDCRQMNEEQASAPSRRICACEKERESSLWGDQGAKLGKARRKKGQN
ncbi:hypothetical protein BU24DRAFT_424369 [Aaosphaeria arxii CBS 175.79]|uniref:Rhodanese domain-containing protein n=1 Tax=Aaosphaeria arxii CBS 175.79 TaxID=1450172 RepID=A0A6A5XJC2_9PLEO|nr:uncharacterized protein BU24DRAFT_424369 [Aaosphaeria arxii CBS 175.79]KAF2013365.1 hypothetical protein BU24DRAFT_424369 [Aaosphaeria arxii CBS 175.79]